MLGLELTDPGFDHTVLSEFRSRLVAGQAEQQLLDRLLEQLQAQGLLQAGGRQRTETTVPGVVVEARFSGQDCTPCPHRARCTRSKKEPRIIGLQPRDQYETLQATREVQTTEVFHQQYAARAGVESTHEQAIRRCDLRQCRYIGLAKTHLQHLVTAVAINLIRVGEWLAGTSTAPTRCSRFAALQGAA